MEYIIRCPICAADHDAVQAIWCSCDPQNPTKLCPSCLSCFCSAGEEFRARFWENAPVSLGEERAALRESRMLLGDIMVRADVITTDQLLQGLKYQSKHGGRFGEAMIALEFLTKDHIDEFLRMQRSVGTFDIARTDIDLGLVREVGVELCRQKRILPLEKETFRGRTLLTLAMVTPTDTDTIDDVQERCGCQVVAAQSSAEGILAFLETHFPEVASNPVSPLAPAAAPTDAPESQKPDLAEQLLRTGLDLGADDMQIFHEGDELQVRYRIGTETFRAGYPPGTTVEDLLAEFRRMAEIGEADGGKMQVLFRGRKVLVDLEAGAAPGGDTVTVRFTT